jgi:uncharacterized membrane protein YfcA
MELADLSTQALLLALAFFTVSVLYASVGHAGATGYIAAMALAGMAPSLMKPTALTLNLVVASIATYKFYKRGMFSWAIFLPLAIASIPCAYLGGKIVLPPEYYRPIVGVVLLYAAWHAFKKNSETGTPVFKEVSKPVLLLVGAILGFLSGLTGVGGGVFLSPMMLVLGWAPIKVISGVAAAFILVNSTAGMAGLLSTSPVFLPELYLWAGAVLIGGWIGSELGSRRLNNNTILKLLGFTILIAGIKLISI